MGTHALFDEAHFTEKSTIGSTSTVQRLGYSNFDNEWPMFKCDNTIRVFMYL